VFIIVLAPLMAVVWTKLGSRQPSTPIKFALGTGIMGVAFLLFQFSANGAPGSSPLLGLVGILLVFTLAELLLSPVGLSLSTKLAPESFRTQMVALFFLSIALGTALSGSLAKYYDPANEVPYFGIIGGVAVAIGVLLALLAPVIRKLMAGVR
jgi:POT family proton-dependent oligopeptide transporter